MLYGDGLFPFGVSWSFVRQIRLFFFHSRWLLHSDPNSFHRKNALEFDYSGNFSELLAFNR
jgi:hypothetical protein